MTETEIHYYRDFLNSDRGTALIEVTAHKYAATKRVTSTFDGYITLKDCNRQIDLEFHFSDEEARQKRLEKITKMQEQVNKMKSLIEEFVFEPKLEKNED